jgi:alpha-L-rhamnosidase
MTTLRKQCTISGFLCLLLIGSTPISASTAVNNLQSEYRTNPLGIDVRTPRLSWQLISNERGVLQSAYQVRVALAERDLKINGRLLWDSGKIASDESTLRPYSGPPLGSRRRYYWQVRVWVTNGQVSPWSIPAYWEMGILHPSDWQADWIEPDIPDNISPSPAVLPRGVKMTPADDASVCRPAPMLRRVFTVTGPVTAARLYITAHGVYEAYINGERVGDYLLTPGWTSYHKRIQYQTYDVTDLLRRGQNAIGALLGDGWYRGFVGGHGWRNVYGERLALLAELHITYTGGRHEVVTTDSKWKATTGPVRWSDLYDGEAYDARLEKTGWFLPDYKDEQWDGVHPAHYDRDVLVASVSPPLREIQEIKPVRIFVTPAGETVADLGQNMVGWVRLKVRGARGTTVTLRHAEVLDAEGNIYTANLRAAAQTDHYTLRGQGIEVFEPHFTFHGFRYVAIRGYPGKLRPDSITGVVIHSAVSPAGELKTSNLLVNQLQHAILWGQKGNLIEVPVDCPQRNERLGWTGDTLFSARSSMYEYDAATFLTKWLRDLASDQLDDGNVPRVVPDVRVGEQSLEEYGRAAWGDAAVFVPWSMYLEYGDKILLGQQYDSMVKWVEYERGRAGEDYIWDRDEQYGDLVAIDETDKDLFATAFFAHSTDLVHRAAVVLGKERDAAPYGLLFAKIQEAFERKFVSPSGTIGNNSQTAMALALAFDLVPEESRSVVAQRLAEDVRNRGHLTTGFAGTKYVPLVLSAYGYSDEVYQLLLQEEYPSWLFMVKHGATTIWERWDGIKPDGSFQDALMNSFNQRVLGSIEEWMWSVMAGIDVDPSAPGYKHVLIQPHPGGGITSVKASHQTPYGLVRSKWEVRNGRFSLSLQVPANTHATVRLPNTELVDVTESGKALSRRKGILGWRQDSHALFVEIGSGYFRFESLFSTTKPAKGVTARMRPSDERLKAVRPEQARYAVPFLLRWRASRLDEPEKAVNVRTSIMVRSFGLGIANAMGRTRRELGEAHI